MSGHETLSPPNELLARLGIEDLDLILKERRLRWYGHVERSNEAVKTALDIQVDGKRGPGKPMEAANREGLQRVEALDYQPSRQIYLEIWCEICQACSKPAILKGAH